MEPSRPSRIAPTIPGAGLLWLLVLGGCGGGEELILPGDGEPAAIEVVEGDGQTGLVGEPLTDLLVVEVTDSRGRPVEGVPVAFELTSAGPGADVIPATTETNSAGLADAQVVLGTSSGQQTGQARVVTDEGRQPVMTTFSAMALSENAHSMAAAAGDDQTGHVGQPLDDLLVVEVRDGFGNPVAGIPISWSVEGGGSVSATRVETGDDGRARVERILGPAVGPQATLAASEGLAGSPVTFVHTAIAGDAARLVVESGDGQTAAAGSTLPGELVVRLVDADGNGIPGTALSWVVAIGGGAAAPENTSTDDEGRARTRWTLGETLGAQRIDAVVSGVGFVSLRATATAGAPATLFIRTQPSATARNGVPFDRQPVIQLRDARGNDAAVAGVQISAAIGSGGGELSGARVKATDAAGRATFTDLAISGAAGRRTLRFTAAGYAGVTSSEIEVAAPPNQPPSASFTVDCADLRCSFNSDGSSDPDGRIDSRTWNFGDGATADARNPAHTYSVPGTYEVALTVTDDDGATNSSSRSVTVNGPPPPPNRPPEADFNWHCEGLTCEFTDASEDDDGDPLTYSWDFGGTGTSNQPNTSHTFPGPDTYIVTLTVTDDGGLSDISDDEVEVEAPPPPNQVPTAQFTWECDELECAFEDESSDSDGQIEEHDWNFGDGDESHDNNPDHSYSSGGTYQVTLTVTDNDDATHSVTHAVTVTAPPPPNQTPTAAFTESCAGLTCSFNSSGSTDPDGNIVIWSWNFGDGNMSTQANPNHTYAADGTYNVTLTVEDDDGATDDETHQLIITAPPPPNAPPSAAFSSSCSGLSCSFDSGASGDTDGTITGWSWDFGDNGVSNEANPTHDYTAAGTYTVSLTVTDDDSATDDATQQVTVEAPAGLQMLDQGVR